MFIETIGNPVLDYTDVKAVAEVAHKNSLPLIVDATFTTPYLLKTIELGADIVVNSLTKWLGGMVVFGIKGGYNAAVKLIDNIMLFSHLANVGDAKSLILHPSSTSHSQLSEDQQRLGGLSPDLIRLSIGLEHPDDLIEALDEALSLT